MNITITTNLGEQNIKKIQAVDSSLKVTDVSALLGTWPPVRGEKVDPANEAKLNVILAETDFLMGFQTPVNLIKRAPHLKWIQIISAGVDNALNAETVKSEVIITGGSGISAKPIGELALTMLLMLVKGFPLLAHEQKNHIWRQRPLGLLDGKTLGIVGLGSIGQEVARLGKAFHMNVIATRRSATKIGKARNVDILYPLSQINRLLNESDFVVLALPYTQENEKFFGEKEFKQMKPGAFFVNVGRGKTVDEEPLIRALREKKIAGAGLDTVFQEPLPPENPLWDMPNVIITPHIAGHQVDYFDKATDLYCENLKRYFSGKRLINLVNKKQGY